MFNLGNLQSQSLTLQNKTYPYITVDDNNKKVVIMTVEQADLINRKYKEIEAQLIALEEEHLILKQINEVEGSKRQRLKNIQKQLKSQIVNLNIRFQEDINE